MDIGKRIRILREKKGIQQLELANKINISQSKMNKIETGYQKKIEPELISEIANALGVSTDYLLGNNQSNELPRLTPKDERDIAKRMEKIKQDLAADGGLSFYGEPLSEEAKESLLEAMEYAVRTAQRINKKYIPKKYREDGDR